MKSRTLKWLMILLASTPAALNAFAGEGPLTLDLKHLETQAVERVTITMDKQLLDFAARFLPKNDPDAQKVRAVVKDLENISVRSLEFDREQAYSAADMEKLRQQFTAPGWSRMMEVRGKDNVDFFIRKAGEDIQAFTIISAEPKELTIITIQGLIKPEQLSDLEGFAGIPEGLWKNTDKKPAAADKDKARKAKKE